MTVGKWIMLFIIVLNLAYIPDAFAVMSFRCGKDIISVGDEPAEVLVKCGNPMSRSGYNTSYFQTWTYNLGKGNFMKRVTFRGDRVTEIETLGRGK